MSLDPFSEENHSELILVFPTVHALIGYFEVTWHLTIKLFPAKISKQATVQKIYDIRG